MNLEEVARLAGVSRSTVSRVVNDDKRVSDEARQRVKAIITEYDYHPHAAARSLATQRTRIIGLLIPQAAGVIFTDPFFPKLIQGAVEGCNASDNNLMMLMDTSDGSTTADRLYRRVIRGRHLDGVVIASHVVNDPIVAKLQGDHYPFLLIGRHPRFDEVSFVDIDNRGAAHDAVCHLLEHGYQRIGIIGGMHNMIAFIDRHGGYVTALQEAGLLPEPELTVHADSTQRGGYRAMQGMLQHNPEAVLVTTDVMAFGALQAIHDAGLRVPEDIAIMGFDGLEQSAISQPPLSTVSQPIGGLGREAVQALLQIIEQPGTAPIHRLLPTKLILRRSCGCIMEDEDQSGGGA